MTPTDDEIVARWKPEPAPLLPLLHAFHDRDGYLSDDALRAVSDSLRIPIADLYGTVTFYHHFARFPPGASAPRVCTGQVCRFRGGLEMLEEMRKDGATPMPCAGRCDEPVPVLQGHDVLIGTSAGALQVQSSPLPPRRLLHPLRLNRRNAEQPWQNWKQRRRPLQQS